MRVQEPTTQTLEISDLKDLLDTLIDEVHRQGTRVVVEQAGVPIAAIISAEDLKILAHLDRQRDERHRVLEAMRAPFRDVPPEEIEREAAKAVAEVRAQRRAVEIARAGGGRRVVIQAVLDLNVLVSGFPADRGCWRPFLTIGQR